MQEGATFGSYRVLRKLGEGGMGIVFLGEHALIGRRAAIKVLHPERSVHREKVERFFNEARATSAVSDPGIVQIYDFGITPENVAFIVMEYLDGEQLDDRITRRGPLAPQEGVRIARQLAGSLAAAHAAGIVHRDLKPENLVMVKDAEAGGGERVKILDFGIAKLGDATSTPGGADRFRTREGAVMGTPAYMSPEQCNDTSTIDHRTDIYSLGCVLFHFLVGRPPYDVYGIAATMAAHLNESPPRLSHVSAHLPVALDELVLRCMAKAPGARFQTMTEVVAACDAVLPALAGLTAVSTTATNTGQRTTLGASAGEPSREVAPPQKRRKVWWIAGASVGALVLGVGIAIATSGGGGGGSQPKQAAAAPIAPVAVPVAVPAIDAPVMIDAPPPVMIDAPPPVMIDAPPVVQHTVPPPKKPPKKPTTKKPDDVYDDR